MSNRRNFIKATVLAAALSSIGMAAHAADTIKVGILHSRVPQFRAKNRGFLPRPLNGIKNLGLETEKPL